MERYHGERHCAESRRRMWGAYHTPWRFSRFPNLIPPDPRYSGSLTSGVALCDSLRLRPSSDLQRVAPSDEINDVAPSLLARRPADTHARGPQAEQRLPGVLSYELAPCLIRPSKDGNNLIARLPSTTCSHLSCTLIKSLPLIPNLRRL
jgi:hypothetical protein